MFTSEEYGMHMDTISLTLSDVFLPGWKNPSAILIFLRPSLLFPMVSSAPQVMNSVPRSDVDLAIAMVLATPTVLHIWGLANSDSRLSADRNTSVWLWVVPLLSVSSSCAVVWLLLHYPPPALCFFSQWCSTHKYFQYGSQLATNTVLDCLQDL